MLKDAVCGLLAVAGAAAIIHANDAFAIATLAFLLAAALSCLRPQLALFCPLLCGGAVAAAQIWNHAGVSTADSPLSALLATGLALAIGTAGAGVGRNLSVLDPTSAS